MKRPVVIEAGTAVDGSARIGFRFVCAAGSIQGAWHASLNDAELSAVRHNRMHHADQETARA